MTITERYVRVWWCLVLNSLRTQMSTSLASAGYLVGKLIRFAFFLVYLLALFQHIPALKGYSMPQVVFFFLTFNLIDVGAQFLFRGFYGVKMLIDEGDFDKILTQPVAPLFRISFMGVDFLDLLTLIPIGVVMVVTVGKLHVPITAFQVLIYVLLLLNGLLLAYGFHVVVGAVSVLTQELEGAVWVYRDVLTLGRFPVSIYGELLKGVLLTVVPIGIMISYPSQALLGLLSWHGIVYAFALGLTSYFVSQMIWRFALRRYTSNSV